MLISASGKMLGAVEIEERAGHGVSALRWAKGSLWQNPEGDSQDFVRNRDFSSARLLLRRAAEAGSAAAALSLGETFDPLVIQQLRVIGVQPDPAKAREWYERAVQLGSDAASQHLAKLAQFPQ